MATQSRTNHPDVIRIHFVARASVDSHADLRWSAIPIK
jgi:hypothetical protein